MALDASTLDDRTIARLLAVIDAAPQDTLSVEWQGMELQVSKGPAPAPSHPAPAPQAPAAAAATATTDATTITAPAIGVALVSQAVRTGSPVKAGDALCQIQVVHDLRLVTLVGWRLRVNFAIHGTPTASLRSIQCPFSSWMVTSWV